MPLLRAPVAATSGHHAFWVRYNDLDLQGFNGIQWDLIRDSMRFNGIYWDLLKLTGWFQTPEKYSPMGCSDIHHLPIPTPKHSSQLRAFCRVFLTSSSGSQKTTQHQWLFPLHHFWIRSYCRANLGFKLHLALFFHKIPRKKKDLRISSWSENLPIQMAQDSSCIKLHQLLCLLCLMLKPIHVMVVYVCMHILIYIYPIPIVPQKKI